MIGFWLLLKCFLAGAIFIAGVILILFGINWLATTFVLATNIFLALIGASLAVVIITGIGLWILVELDIG